MCTLSFSSKLKYVLVIILLLLVYNNFGFFRLSFKLMNIWFVQDIYVYTYGYE